MYCSVEGGCSLSLVKVTIARESKGAWMGQTGACVLQRVGERRQICQHYLLFSLQSFRRRLDQVLKNERPHGATIACGAVGDISEPVLFLEPYKS